MGKKDKLPRGVGRVPEWWLEITPHDTLYLAEDEAQRKAAYEEKLRFAKLAAEQDLLQKYGGEGFPNWNPASDGPRTKEEEKEWVSKGYKRNEKNEWVDEGGAPLEGRQFKGQMPPGYLPGEYFQDLSGGSITPGPGGLNPAKYERDKDKDWEKPAWMQVKLRSTGTGGAIRQGDEVDRPITKGDGTRVPRSGTDEDADPTSEGDKKGIDGIVDEEAAEEIYEDEETNEFVDPTAPAKATIHHSTPQATEELQAILNRRKTDDEQANSDAAGGDPTAPAKATIHHSTPKASDELQAILNRRKQVSD
jgi:hypothetical protein